MAGFGSGEFAQANTDLLLGVDLSARASDGELQVVLADGHPEVLAALVFHLCEQAERLDPYIADIIDERGYPFTNRGHVLEPILRGRDMHLRPFDRRFLVTDSVYTWQEGMELLLGRPFEDRETRNGISMQLTNENSDALTGYGGVTATDEQKQEIRGYTRILFAEVMDGVDLGVEAELFTEDIQSAHSSPAE